MIGLKNIKQEREREEEEEYKKCEGQKEYKRAKKYENAWKLNKVQDSKLKSNIVEGL